MAEKKSKFNPESDGYDYSTALIWGMGPTGTGENEGHWGSVAPAPPEYIDKYNIPENSYLVLKGRNHATFSKAVEGERKRGYEVKKFGDRYFSVPKTKKGAKK